MTIQFYLDNEEETEITSFYDLQSNPFKLNDEICLSVDQIYSKEYNKYKKETARKFMEDNDKSRQCFHCKKIKLIRERKYLRFNIDKSHLTIEYHCVEE